MRTTINQVRVELRELQEGHRQLNDFFWGDFLRAIKQKTVRYPLMCCYYTSGTMANNTTPLNLIVIIADRVFKDHENLNDTESDTAQVCRDLKNVMTRSKRWNRIGRFGDAPIEKFIDKGHDEVAGHIMRIPFTLFDTSDICELPLVGYDLDDTTQPSCLPATIINSDGDIIMDVASGDIGTLPDTTIIFTVNGEEQEPISIVTLGDETINLNISYGN